MNDLNVGGILAAVSLGVLAWGGTTLFNNSIKIASQGVEIHHINENVEEIKQYWIDWSNSQKE